MDTRPQGKPSLRAQAQPDGGQPQKIAYDPPFLGGVYGFPADTDGSGQTAAIIELGGGYVRSDLDTYFKNLKIPAPKIRDVGVGGAQNSPGHDPTVDVEVHLDIEVLGAMAPGAEMVVYFAPNNDKGWLDSISAAVHATPTPTVVSISWGASENLWTAQSSAAMEQVFADAAALGVTVCGPAGDNGSTDGQTDGAAHLDYPGSSPHVLAVGGTSLRLNPEGNSGTETVWNDGSDGGATGGGVSETFPLPAWQSNVGVPNRSGTTSTGRGVPDVAAVADPSTGYALYISGKNPWFWVARVLPCRCGRR
jgi:kumamolisin